MKRSSIVFVLFCLGFANARAQTPVRLTLDDAIARGLEASHRVAEIDARREAARAVEDQRQAASMPQLALQAGYTRTNHVDEFGIPGGRVISDEVEHSTRRQLACY